MKPKEISAEEIATGLIAEFGEFPDGFPDGHIAAGVLSTFASLLEGSDDSLQKRALNLAAKHIRNKIGGSLKGREHGSFRGMMTSRPLYSLLEGGDFPNGANTLRVMIILGIINRLAQGNAVVISHVQSLSRISRSIRDGETRYQKLGDVLERAPREKLCASFVERVQSSVESDSSVRYALSEDQLQSLSWTLNECKQAFGIESSTPADVVSEDETTHYLPSIEYLTDGDNDPEITSGGLAPGDLLTTTVHTTVEFRQKVPRQVAYLIATQAQYARLEKAPDPVLGRCLVAAEAKSYIELLEDFAHEERDELRKLAAILLLMQFYTAQRLDGLASLVWTQDAPRPGTLTQDGGYTVSIPEYEKFVKVSEGLTGYVSKGQVTLRLPDRLFQRIRSDCQHGKRVFSGFPAGEVAGMARHMVSEVRRKRERVTVDRAAQTLPTYIYVATEDARLMQLIGGSSYGLTPWPLFYLAKSQTSLQKLYDHVWAALENGQEPTHFKDVNDLPGSIIGSSLGAAKKLGTSIIKSLDHVLETQSPARKIGRWSAHEWLVYLNLQSRKTAWMFASAVGHRNTNSIGKLRYGDFDLNSSVPSVVLGDKLYIEDGVAYGYRICSLGLRILPNQIKALIAAYARFVIAAEENSDLMPYRGIVINALSSHGSLFLDFATPGGASASQAWMIDGLPDNQIPVNIYRHLFASSYCLHGGSPESLCKQLGHSYFKEDSFGQTSDDSPHEFLLRAAPVIESMLNDWGWHETSVNPSWPLIELGVSERLRLIKSQMAGESQDLSLSKQRRNEERDIKNEIGDIINEELEAYGVIRKNPDQIVKDLKTRIEKAMWSRNAEYAKNEITRQVSNPEEKEVDSVSVSSLYLERNDYIRPVGYASWLLFQSLRAAKSRWDLCSQSDKKDQNSKLPLGVISAALDLLLYHPISDIGHLMGILSFVPEASCVSAVSGVIQLTYSPRCGQAGSLNKGNANCVWLSPHVATRISRHIPLLIESDIASDELVADINNWLKSEGAKFYGPNGLKWLLNIAHESWKFELPGHLAALVGGCRKASALPENRIVDVLKNGIGNGEGWPDKRDNRMSGGGTPKVLKHDLSWSDTLAAVRRIVLDASPGKSEQRLQARRLLKAKLEDLENGSEVPFQAVVVTRFAQLLFSSRARQDKKGDGLAISTISKYLDSAILVLQLMSVESEHVGSLEDIYSLVLDGNTVDLSGEKKYSSNIRSKKASLRRLQELLECEFGYLPVDPVIWQGYKSEDVARAELVTDAEFCRASEIITSWHESSCQLGEPQERQKFMIVCSIIMGLQYYCGLRPMEASSLAFSDLIWANDEPIQVIVRTNEVWRVKNNKSCRILWLPIGLRRKIKDWIDSLEVDVDNNSNDPVFAPRSNVKGWSREVGDFINSVLRLATRSESARQYSLRHSYCGNSVERRYQGLLRPNRQEVLLLSIGMLANRMAHSDPSVTLAHYLHEDHLEAAFVDLNAEPSKTELAFWLGKSLSSRKRWAQRLASHSEELDEATLGEQFAARNSLIFKPLITEKSETQPKPLPEYDRELLSIWTWLSDVTNFLCLVYGGKDWSVAYETANLPFSRIEKVYDAYTRTTGKASKLGFPVWIKSADMGFIEISPRSTRSAKVAGFLGALDDAAKTNRHKKKDKRIGMLGAQFGGNFAQPSMPGSTGVITLSSVEELVDAAFLHCHFCEYLEVTTVLSAPQQAHPVLKKKLARFNESSYELVRSAGDFRLHIYREYNRGGNTRSETQTKLSQLIIVVTAVYGALFPS